ncbi:hypothetical protein KVL89_06795 [Helicobacter pylori]|uniref:Uncharacterized protein n=2 Tax=Helicobacter pylori TaxID=210 RepID=A0AAW8XJA8_HELPX|nr:hypothetical protein [Helicobacter pylori]MDU9790724.1 hypothetical protein [Helicobacter pylori]WQY53370.1 hypothetical protein KVM40_04665 [Helicobacter pylori]WQY53762.1 hypothetical protein KVM40_06910 [Helicobacter pylori]WQY55200.1 hypothetical protein KVL89_06795 [Helicobacter pylori]WRD19879.1 hypothetical protein E5K56_06840 [Helicobacter pylori]
MTQLEDLKAHEKYNLLLCLFKSDYYNDPKNTDLEGKPFKQACEECTLTFFRPRMDKVAEYKDFEKVRQADYAVAIVYEKSAIKGVKIQRSVFALKIDHDRIEVDDGGSLGIYGVCAQKGSQEYEELVNKNAWCLTNSPRLNNSMKLIKRKS